jgi:hypothetical protein
MIEVQIIGMSHTNAVRAALARHPDGLRSRIEILHLLAEVPDKRFIDDTPQGPRLHALVRAKLERAAGGRAAAFMQAGGNAHNFLGLFEHPQPFDFVLPNRPDLPLDLEAELVPCDFFAEVMRQNLQFDFTILAAARNDIAGALWHLESPPPVGDSEYCQNNLPPVFLTDHYRGMKVASRAFRYKLWRLHSDMVREECERLGIGFVACPPASMDPHGCLRPELYADPLHGNDSYGQLVLQQVLELTGREERLAPAAKVLQ